MDSANTHLGSYHPCTMWSSRNETKEIWLKARLKSYRRHTFGCDTNYCPRSHVSCDYEKLSSKSNIVLQHYIAYRIPARCGEQRNCADADPCRLIRPPPRSLLNGAYHSDIDYRTPETIVNIRCALVRCMADLSQDPLQINLQ